MDTFDLRSIGAVESDLTDVADAPRQAEGAPEAWLVMDAEVAEAMQDIAARDVLSTYRGHDPSAPVLRVDHLEAVHGTPIVDLKPVLDEKEG